MTRMPERFSLVTALTRSICFWTMRNLGIIKIIAKIRKRIMKMSPPATIQVSEPETKPILTIAQIAVIGAAKTMRIMRRQVKSICWQSFVTRVTSDAAENFLISACEKEEIFSLSSFLMRPDHRAVTTAAKKPTEAWVAT